MRTTKKTILLAFVFTLFTQTIRSIELPKAPTGFTWQEVPDLKAAFLKPNGWFFNQGNLNGNPAYFITQEDFSDKGKFNTGLTITVSHVKKGSATERGKTFIDQMAAQLHVKSWNQTAGSFQEFGCELKDTYGNGTVSMYAVTVANPKTDTLYTFLFESPAADWDAAWTLGKQIIDTLAINDDF